MSTALKKLSLTKRVMVGTILLFGFTATGLAASVPAPYRDAPNSVFAEFSDINLDGTWIVESFNSVPGGFPLDINPPTVTPLGGIGSDLEIFLPNFIDPLPIKFIRINIGCDGCSNVPAPFVDAFDPEGIDSILVGPEMIVDGNSKYWDIEIRPNPDFELIILDGVVGNVFSIEIDTISTIPIPAALPLFLSAIGALGFIRWRRQKLAA